MATKNSDSAKSGRDSKSGKFIHRDDAAKKEKHVVETEKKDKGGTESTGPKKK